MTARLLAARCLLDVDGGAYSNLAFKKRAAASGLSRQDLAFAAAVFYGTLERQVTLDWFLAPCLKKGAAGLDPEVRVVLRSGLYQCLYLESVPVRAAVDESVRLCRALKKSSAAPLVNAVLRKASARSLADIETIADPLTRAGVRYALCPELARLFLDQYGGEAEAMMDAMFRQPRAALRVNSLRCTPPQAAAALAADGVTCGEAPLAGALLVCGGDYLASGALRRGDVRVQSLAAQTAALALGALPGESVLDLCAAPGGKTLTIAQQMGDRGRILALDRYAGRLELLKKQAALEGVNIAETVAADAATYATEERFDRVLCDVPCSGYGEIAAKPELRHKAPQEASALPALQGAILANGARLLKAGGRLVYSTCTLDRRENEEVVRGFLAAHPDFRAVRPQAAGGQPGPDGSLKFIPCADDPEGFFIATFERM